MAKRLCKCIFCEEQFDVNSEPCVKIGRRYAHIKCAEEEEKNENSEYKQKIKLESLICELFKSNYVPPNIKRQINDYKTLGYTYQGMYYTLFYFYRTKQNQVKRQSIGIIPYKYEEANNYYKEIYDRMIEDKAKNEESLSKEVKVIKIQLPTQKPTIRKKIKKFKILDD